MEEEPENEVREEVPKLVIPPPVLSRPQPPPPPPLSGHARAEQATPEGSPAVNVRIRPPGEVGEHTLPADGIATFNSRAIAVLIDLAVSLGLVIATVSLLHISRLGMLVAVAYMLTRDSLPFLNGQSIGKKAMKIKAVDLAGNSLAGDWKTGVIRNISLVIPLVPIVELFILLTREDGPNRGRRLGDEWAKTKVIVHEPPVENQAG